VSADDEDGPFEDIELYPVRSITLRPTFSEDDRESSEQSYYSEPDDDVLEETLEFEIPEEERGPEYISEPRMGYDAGFEMRTYRIFGPDADISPALIVVEEQWTNRRFYFGFFSISIRW